MNLLTLRFRLRTGGDEAGNDRCVEEGGSATQGDSTSDPDDDGRGPGMQAAGLG